MKGINNMCNAYNTCSCPYCASAPVYDLVNMYDAYRTYPCSYYFSSPMYNSSYPQQFTDQYIPFTNEPNYDFRFDTSQPMNDSTLLELKDYGPQPFVVNINEATKQNNTFRTALWTGKHLQLTLMSINVGEEIGLEIHPDLDQFIRIEEGQGLVKMGDRKNNLNFQKKVQDDFIFIIPAGKWHNLINTGDIPLKLYSIYAPPQHPKGTVHVTKAAAEAAEQAHSD